MLGGLIGLALLPQRDAGVKVGLGVDGSASNDSGDLMTEARQALLLQRVSHGSDALSAREALEIATLGGAQVLGRGDLGALDVGKRADFAIYRTDTIALSGAWDPVAGLIFCGPIRAEHTIVEGRFVVRDGHLATMELPVLLERHKVAADKLITGS